MRVDFGFNIQQRNSLRNMMVNPARAVNQSVILGGKSVRRDTLAISGHGTGNNDLLEHLKDQKEAVKKKQDELLTKTLENGGKKEDIKAVLDMYDDQISELDKQMDLLKTEQLQRQVKLLQVKQKSEQEKTDLEKLNDKMARIDSLDRELSRVQQLDSLKDKVDGEISILKSEMERDITMIDHIVERAEGSGTNMLAREDVSTHVIDGKEETLEEMEELSDELAGKVGGKLAQLMEKLKESGKAHYTKQTAAEPVEETEESALAPTEEGEEAVEEAEATEETTDGGEATVTEEQATADDLA